MTRADRTGATCKTPGGNSVPQTCARVDTRHRRDMHREDPMRPNSRHASRRRTREDTAPRRTQTRRVHSVDDARPSASGNPPSSRCAVRHTCTDASCRRPCRTPGWAPPRFWNCRLRCLRCLRCRRHRRPPQGCFAGYRLRRRRRRALAPAGGGDAGRDCREPSHRSRRGRTRAGSWRRRSTPGTGASCTRPGGSGARRGAKTDSRTGTWGTGPTRTAPRHRPGDRSPSRSRGRDATTQNRSSRGARA